MTIKVINIIMLPQKKWKTEVFSMSFITSRRSEVFRKGWGMWLEMYFEEDRNQGFHNIQK